MVDRNRTVVVVRDRYLTMEPTDRTIDALLRSAVVTSQMSDDHRATLSRCDVALLTFELDQVQSGLEDIVEYCLCRKNQRPDFICTIPTQIHAPDLSSDRLRNAHVSRLIYDSRQCVISP